MKTWPPKSRLLEWMVALTLLMVFMGCMLVALLSLVLMLDLASASIAKVIFISAVAVLSTLPLWMLLGSFFLAPLFRVRGILNYHSPYLITSRAKPGCIELHGAMLFDYLHLFSWKDRGPRAVRRILLWYVEGLIALVHAVRSGAIPQDTILTGTSYIFSRSTAERFGFTVEQRPEFSWLGYLNYLTQWLTYSFAQGRWTFPPIHRAKKASIKAENLSAQLDRLLRVQKRLSHSVQME